MWKTRVLSLLASLTLLAQQAAPPQLLVIDRVTIFDGTGNPTLRNGVIVIQDGKIRDMGVRGNIRSGPGITILDARGKFAVPGLIDAHVHFDQSAGLFARPDAIDLRSIRPYAEEIEWTRLRLNDTLLRYLRAGITGVVDMGGPIWSLGFRDSANQSPLSPRVAAAGPLISTVADPELESEDSPVLLMETPEDALRIVRQVAERNPDLIKILFIIRPDENLDQLTGLVNVAINESHKLGIRVAAHATQLDTAKAALNAGADILVHSIEDRRVDAEFLSMLKARNAIYIPTLMVTERYDEVFKRSVKLNAIERRLGDPEVIESWSELGRIPLDRIPGGIPTTSLRESRQIAFLNLQILDSAGVRIAAGTDAGNIGTLHGPSLHHEMELMEEAGMRPTDILIAATRHAAAVMGASAERGTLERGKAADVLLLDEDPTRDIQNTQKIFKLIRAGQVVEIP
jgi:imidazolonepropionase-like amidohydrolase